MVRKEFDTNKGLWKVSVDNIYRYYISESDADSDMAEFIRFSYKLKEKPKKHCWE